MDADEVHERWAERSGEYSPAYYAYYGPDETSEVVRRYLEDAVDRDAPVLELGCSSGRHLAHLHEHGYGDLHGIEINGESFEVMEDSYPALAAAGTFYHDAIETVLPGFEDDRFGAVYSVETLQHVHPDNAWVFDEVARVAADLLVTVENEGGDNGDVNYVNDDYASDEFPLYYRDWGRVFADRGFAQVGAEPTDRDTLRALRPVEE